MKVLIFGTSYVEGQHSRYLFELWRDLVRKLNPGIDVLVVDSASPDLPHTGDFTISQLGDNIGHLMKTGRDGWGRAFCEGLQRAIDEDYDYAAFIECDVLLAKPVMLVIRQMMRHDIDVSCPMASPYSMIATEIMFMSAPAMRRLIEKYDWENSPIMPYAETRIAEIFANDLWCLPCVGCRNDLGHITAQNMKQKFPAGIDWITHCEDVAVYREFLRMNGLDII